MDYLEKFRKASKARGLKVLIYTDNLEKVELTESTNIFGLPKLSIWYTKENMSQPVPVSFLKDPLLTHIKRLVDLAIS